MGLTAQIWLVLRSRSFTDPDGVTSGQVFVVGSFYQMALIPILRGLSLDFSGLAWIWSVLRS